MKDKYTILKIISSNERTPTNTEVDENEIVGELFSFDNDNCELVLPTEILDYGIVSLSKTVSSTQSFAESLESLSTEKNTPKNTPKNEKQQVLVTPLLIDNENRILHRFKKENKLLVMENNPPNNKGNTKEKTRKNIEPDTIKKITIICGILGIASIFRYVIQE